MHILSRLSVRSILDAVFLTLAVALCCALALLINTAWQAVGLGGHLTALAEANRVVSQGMQDMRDRSNDALVALQGSEDARAVVADAHARTIVLLNDAIDAVQRSGAPGVEASVATVQGNWPKLDGEWQAMVALAAKPKAERDTAAIIQWSRNSTDFTVGLGRMSLAVNNEGRVADPGVGELVAISQLGWMAQDSSGLECVVPRTLLATSKPLAAEQHATVDHFRGSADAAFAMLGDIMARPGIAPALVGAFANAKETILKARPERDAVYRRLDDSGHELMSWADWRKICTLPVLEMYKLIKLSIDMMSERAEATARLGQRQLLATGLASAVAVPFCIAGLWLVRRRVTQPVKRLTATIERLARRDYHEAVARGGSEDEFDTMATASRRCAAAASRPSSWRPSSSRPRRPASSAPARSTAIAATSTGRSAPCSMPSTPPARR